MFSSRLLPLVLASLCLCGLVPAAARADGDPASDVLVTEDVFVPYGSKLPVAKAVQFANLVHDAKAHGYNVKVALIATPYDLGSVTSLWRQPQRYAQFLGQELFFVYKGRLLIVMPNGYGIYHANESVSAERKLLDGLRLPAETDLITAGSVGVRRLAGASGIELAPGTATGRATHHSHAAIVTAALVVGAWLLITALVLFRRRRLRRDES
jgi:hypothetical protein